MQKNLVGKMLKSKKEGALEYEFLICKKAYEKNISVPKPEGVFLVEISQGIQLMFVMEYIPGPTLKKFLFEDYTKYQKLSMMHKQEINLAKQAGFSEVDDHPSNCIFNLETQKLYLIDFRSWKIN